MSLIAALSLAVAGLSSSDERLQGSLIITRPQSKEVMSLRVLRADTPSPSARTMLAGSVEWYRPGQDLSSTTSLLIEYDGAGAKQAASFLRMSDTQMLVADDDSSLKMTFVGSQDVIAVTVEDARTSTIIMVATAIGNWKIDDAAAANRSLPAVLAMLTAQIGADCNPSFDEVWQSSQSLCKPSAPREVTWSCTGKGDVAVTTTCEPSPSLEQPRK